jgi:hypothetical protein
MQWGCDSSSAVPEDDRGCQGCWCMSAGGGAEQFCKGACVGVVAVRA